MGITIAIDKEKLMVALKALFYEIFYILFYETKKDFFLQFFYFI